MLPVTIVCRTSGWPAHQCVGVYVQWLMSDDKYGCGSTESNEFRNFNLWMEVQENQKKT